MASSTEAVKKLPTNMKTFFIIWVGQLISILGSNLTSFGLGVWIYEQTGKATPFALTALFATLPALLLSPLAGAFADRYNRRLIMILADTGDALVTGAAVVMIFRGQIQVWHIYVIAFVSSCFSAFQGPASQASVTMLVPKDKLARAGGIMQMGMAITTILTPILAGMMYGLWGLKWIILIDFMSYFFAIGALLFVQIPQPKRREVVEEGKASIWTDILFGWRYLSSRKGLFWLLWYFALVNFLLNLTGILSTPLVLSFGTATELGILQTVSGVAMLLGGLAMSAWGGPKFKKVWYVIGFIGLSGVGMIITGLRANLWVISSGRFLFLICIPFASAISQAVFQTKVAPDVQGRVFSIRGMIAQSMIPLAFLLSGPLNDLVFDPMLLPGGSLADSFVARVFGVGTARGTGLMFAIAGVLLIVVSLLIFSNTRVRQIEVELPDAEIDLEEPVLRDDQAPELSSI